MKDLEYDKVKLEKSDYWEDTRYWNYTNLNDGEISYSSNTEGRSNCTLFLYAGDNIDESDKNSWSRFVIDLGQDTEVGQIRIAVGGSDGRVPKKVTAYYIDKFVDGTEENSTYASNIIKQDNTGLTQIATKTFDSTITIPTWVRFKEQTDKITTGYLLFEIDGYMGDDCAVLNEIEIFDKQGEQKLFDILPELEYDSAKSGKSKYWDDMRYWNYTNLNDEQTVYVTNKDGEKNCTIFLYEGNQDSWARFIIDLKEEVKLENVDIWIGGGVYERMPKTINIFTVDNFVNGTGENSTYSNNVAKKDNTELTLFSTKTFNTVQTTSQKYTFM